MGDVAMSLIKQRISAGCTQQSEGDQRSWNLTTL